MVEDHCPAFGTGYSTNWLLPHTALRKQGGGGGEFSGATVDTGPEPLTFVPLVREKKMPLLMPWMTAALFLFFLELALGKG